MYVKGKQLISGYSDFNLLEKDEKGTYYNTLHKEIIFIVKINHIHSFVKIPKLYYECIICRKNLTVLFSD